MTQPSTNRIEVIDMARGLVMVLMTLDHTRDYFGNHDVDALDVSVTTPALFFSRWITHLCAPTFVFLAGSSASMLSRKLEAHKLSKYLITRGIILIVLEQTLLRCFGWYFNFDYHYMSANVLFGIGSSMILLSLFTHMPQKLQLPLSLALMVLPTLLAYTPGTGIVWQIILSGGNIEFLPGYNFYVSYPILPWFGIMALGYALGIQFGSTQSRTTWTYWTMAFMGLFVLLRVSGFGNPNAWQHQQEGWRTVIAFVNLEKYPPSLQFTLLTLSFTFLFFALLPKVTGRAAKLLNTLGKTPLLYYVAHITLIHAAAVVVAWIRYGHAEWLYNGPGIFWGVTLPGHPGDYGLSLPWVYLITMLVVGALYIPSAWYSKLRSRNP